MHWWKGQMRMTIKDIAKAAGTSYSTVSRVLNKSDYHCSSPELEEKIWRIAREMDYVPDESARNLKMKKSTTDKSWYVHILHVRKGDEEADSYYEEILKLLSPELYQNNTILSNVWYMSCLANDRLKKSSDLKNSHQKILRQTENHRDGIIVLGHCNPQTIEFLQRQFKAVLMIVRNGEEYEVDEIITEGGRTIQKAIEHLFLLGHRKIGYVGACRYDESFQKYTHAMERFGAVMNQSWVVEASRTEEAGREAMKYYLSLEEKPSAIYFMNDIIAVGALRYLGSKKNRYYNPAIISCDGIEEGKYTTPMLSTMEAAKEDIARIAVETLLGRLQKRHTAPIMITLEGRLVIRESCQRFDEIAGCEYYI